jgi:hypothetical protein
MRTELREGNEMGRLGLVHENPRKGDLVCILYGCSVPVVLREIPLTAERFAYEQKANYAEDELEAAITIQRGYREIRRKRAERERKRAEWTRRNTQSRDGHNKAHHQRVKKKPMPDHVEQITLMYQTHARDITAKCYEQGMRVMHIYQWLVACIPPVCLLAYKYVGRVTLQPPLIAAVIGVAIVLAIFSWLVRRLWSSLTHVWYAALPYKFIPELLNRPSRRKADRFYYQVIGDCYVHGMMDGEAIAYQNERQIKPQTFELR